VSKGQCLCGGVQFEVDGHMGDVRLCYCSLCRRANGTAFSANARVPKARYRIIAGEELLSEYEASPGAFRNFCRRCGSPTHARVEWDDDHIRIRLGLLDQSTQATVTAHVWVESKPEWYCIEGSLPQYARSL
jgi:hypothetical protein